MYSIPVRSIKSGYISEINTMDLGLISMKLGAGRETLEDVIDPTAGILLSKKLGDKVAKGDVLLTLYTEKPGMQALVTSALNDFEFSNDPIEVPPVVEERIEMDSFDSFLIEKD